MYMSECVEEERMSSTEGEGEFWEGAASDQKTTECDGQIYSLDQTRSKYHNHIPLFTFPFIEVVVLGDRVGGL